MMRPIWVARDEFGWMLFDEEPELVEAWHQRRFCAVRCYDRAKAAAIFTDATAMPRWGADVQVNQARPAYLFFPFEKREPARIAG